MKSPAPWLAVGNVPPREVSGARRECHHAAQIVVAACISFLPKKPDDSHTSLEWIGGLSALAGGVVAARPPFRVALRLRDLALLLLKPDETVVSQYSLAGNTLAGGYRWLRQQVEDAGLDPNQLTSARHFTIPGHPVEEGGVFATDSRFLEEMNRYYSNSALVFGGLLASTPAASPVRCWPHHFDIATLINEGGTRTIGVGLSPGDENYDEPYYYVTPYPYPEGELPILPAGRWHRKGWTGAVLTATEICQVHEAESQRGRVMEFLDSAVAACRSMNTSLS
ncbi:MAG: hypothetical protein ABI613_09190 [Gemmatimonadota bacterium]